MAREALMGPVIDYLLAGARMTLLMSAACIGASLVAGVTLGLLAAVGPRFLATVIAVAVFAARGTPVLIQIFVTFYGLPLLGVHLSAGCVVFLAVSAYAAVLIAEIVRGAFVALPRGQANAARALGMREWQVACYILLPQALRYALPPMVSIMPLTIKATSLGSLVGFSELATASHEMAAKTLQVLPIFAVTFGLYFLLCFPVSRLAARLERLLTVHSPSQHGYGSASRAWSAR
jgi:polar amino acid transport system permease protein